MEFPLQTFTNSSNDPEKMDSREAVPHLMALMKNTFVRAFNRNYYISSRIDSSGTSFHSFIEYLRGALDLLATHIEADKEFFSVPNQNGRTLESILGSLCIPPVDELCKSLKAFRDDLSSWHDEPKSYTMLTLRGHFLNVGTQMMAVMKTQLDAVDVEKLKEAFSQDEMRSKMRDNMGWFASRCELPFLLPFILSHHDPSTSPYWPNLPGEGKPALPSLMDHYAKYWVFAPFDPLTRKENVV